MLVAIQHVIRDPAGFWQTVESNIGNMPDGYAVRSVLPSPDGRTCNCLWDAPDVASLQAWMDEALGPFADNHCFEVDAARAIGLPHG